MLEWIPLKWFLPVMVHPDDPVHWELKMMFETYGWKCGGSKSVLEGEDFDAAAKRWKEFERVRGKAFEGREIVKNVLMENERKEWELKVFGERLETEESRTDPKNTTAEMEDRENQLEIRRQAAHDAQQELAKEMRNIGVTKEDLDKKWENAWREYLYRLIDLHERNLKWWKSDEGRKYAKSADLKKERDKMDALKKRFVVAESQPKTALEAIKPR